MGDFYWGRNDLEFFMLSSEGKILYSNAQQRSIKTMELPIQAEVVFFECFQSDKTYKRFLISTADKQLIYIEKNLSLKNDDKESLDSAV